MTVYTNVFYDYKKILLAEKNERGQTEYKEVEFENSLFVPSKDKTNFKSISGEYLSEIKFESFDSYKEFVDQYSNIKNFEIHGDIGIEYKFINSTYGTDISYDFSQLDISYIDIETSSEKGFPSVDNPEEEVIVISLSSTKKGKTTFCKENSRQLKTSMSMNFQMKKICSEILLSISHKIILISSQVGTYASSIFRI